jgi:hypothetical protein
MPNHVTNILRFDGNQQRIDELLEFVSTEKLADDPDNQSHLFDFDKIIPRPKELDITSQFITNDPDKVRSILEKKRKDYNWDMTDEKFEEKVERETDLAKVYKSNIEKYGFRTWYDWSIANWGTKWNCYDVFLLDDNSIEFDTAWSTPQPIIEALSKKFPDIVISVDYADEDIGSNCGQYSYENGELTEEWQPYGEAATRFALEVKGYDVDEYLEEMEELEKENE